MATQVERLAALETETKLTREEVVEVKGDVKEIRVVLEGLVEKLDGRYAPKWVGDAMKAFFVMTALAVITFALFDPFKRSVAPQQNVTITTQNPDGTTTTKIVPLSQSGTSVQAAAPSLSPTSQPQASQSPAAPQQQSPNPLNKLPVIGGLFK